MLQRDRQGSDIRPLLERGMAMWHNGQFDALFQELFVVTCLRNSRLTSNDSQDHLIRVFTKLMLQGNYCATVQWITERSGGGVLMPSDFTEVSHPNGKKSSMTVFDVLHTKHPELRIPKDFAIPLFDTLPCLEDSEITSFHIQSVAHQLQGEAGPDGCDSSHWRDTLLRYGASSVRLRDSVATLCRRICNQLYPGMISEHW